MKKFVLMLLTVLCALLILAGCGSEKTEESAEEKIFRLGVGGSKDSYRAEFNGSVALEEKYLEEELGKIGYQLEVVNFSGVGPEVAAALASKDIDAGFMGDIPLINSVVAGVPIKVEAVLTESQPICVVVNDDSVQKVKDLEGKKVTMTTGTIFEYYWRQLVKKQGIDESKIEIIYDNSGTDYLASGQVDGIVIYSLTAQVYTENQIGRIVEDSIDPEVYSSSVFAVVRTEISEENPELVSAMQKALERAYEACSEDHEVLYRDCSSAYITEEMWKNGIEGMVDFECFNPRIEQKNIETVGSIMDWMYENGYITEKVEAETLFDQNYME